MHRYYIHVLDSLLQGQRTYSVYEIRHPFPPYLTHYGILLLLFHMLPYDWAEKVFACLIVLLFALGLRFSAKQIGPAGGCASLFCAPLLLGWPLMMGFFNFTLGVGLLLLLTAVWQRLGRDSGRALLVWAVLLGILTFTHPVPLLLLILICGFDLALSFLWRARDSAAHSFFRQHRIACAALALAVAAAAFPALAIDPSKTSSTLGGFGFHSEFTRTALLLTGVSPYNTRSTSVFINLYRVCLYAILAISLLLGARASLRAFRLRRAGFGVTVFLATVALLVALPFIPYTVNGSDYFSTRLVFLLWPGALLAASAAPLPGPLRQRWLAVAALGCCILALVPAQIFIRPAGRQLRVAEEQPLPPGVPGSLLLSDKQDSYIRFHNQTAFDPYKWGAILPFVRANDVALDSPWIDQTITPIRAVPGGPELVDDISQTFLRHPPNPEAALVPGRSLPGNREARIVRDSAFMILMAPPDELSQGLATQLSPSEAAKYRCRPAETWYILCTTK